LDPSALHAVVGIAASFLSSADAASLSSAIDSLQSRFGLKPKASKNAVRTLVIALGGAVKFGLSSEALGADLKAVGA
jgi:hypothetical protein